MHRRKHLLDWETNPTIYSRLRKDWLEKIGEIHCARCPYHKIENAKNDRSHRSWKNYRGKQYKPK